MELVRLLQSHTVNISIESCTTRGIAVAIKKGPLFLDVSHYQQNLDKLICIFQGQCDIRFSKQRNLVLCRVSFDKILSSRRMCYLITLATCHFLLNPDIILPALTFNCCDPFNVNQVLIMQKLNDEGSLPKVKCVN